MLEDDERFRVPGQVVRQQIMKGALPLAQLNAAGERLDDLGRAEEAVEVFEHETAGRLRRRALGWPARRPADRGTPSVEFAAAGALQAVLDAEPPRFAVQRAAISAIASSGRAFRSRGR